MNEDTVFMLRFGPVEISVRKQRPRPYIIHKDDLANLADFKSDELLDRAFARRNVIAGLRNLLTLNRKGPRG